MLVKIIVSTIFIFFTFSGLVISQPRHVKGMQMGGVVLSHSPSQVTAGVVYQRYLSDVLSLKCNGFFQSITKGTTTYTNYIVNPEALYAIGNKNALYVNLKAGFFVGSGFAKSEIVSKKSFFVGEEVGFNVELFIVPKFKVDLDLNQQFYQKALFANYTYGFKVSLLYCLN